MRRPLTLSLALFLCSTSFGFAQQAEKELPALEPFDAPKPFPAGGLVKLDVVVTDKAGKPVTSLGSEDFTLLDNGQPRKLVTFEGFNNADALPNRPAEVILVIDCVNMSTDQVSVAEREVVKFLRQNNGSLTQSVSIYRLTDKGLFASAYPSTNGNDLASEVADEKDPRVVWTGNLHASEVSVSSGDLARINAFSLRALGSIVLEQRRKPGRKMIIWLGPGWPSAVGVNSFDWVTEFSTRMREARIASTTLPSGQERARILSIRTWSTR